MSASAQEVTASMQGIAAQISDSTCSVQEVVLSAQRLNELAEHLWNLIRIFQLDHSGAHTHPESRDSTLLLRAA